MSFLCAINGSAPVISNYTGYDCGRVTTTMDGADLNLPSIMVSSLNQTRTISRRVKNIGDRNETYGVTWSPPDGVSVKVTPSKFFIMTGETRNLTVRLTATVNSSSASFGRIGFYGNRGHVSNVQVSVISKTTYI